MSLELDYRVSGKGTPVILLHGLFGSGKNLNFLARHLASGFKVFQPDLRNHGNSPHTTEMGYQVMADDITHFIDCHNLSDVIFIGHSMGGKVAMFYALNNPKQVEKLIVLDIAPVNYTHNYGNIFHSMNQVPLDRIVSRSEAEQHLNADLEDISLCRFLLQNLVRNDKGFLWRLNISAIEKNIEQIISFPEIDDRVYFEKPVCFIGGINSDFITQDHHQAIFRLFPRARIKIIEGAGHMLHVEQPGKLQEIIDNIIP